MSGKLTESAQVRARFSRAAEGYDRVADFQRMAGEMLLAGMSDLPPGRRILDAGCGTGHGRRLLLERWPDLDVLSLDFSLPMVGRAGSGLRLCADMHHLPLRPGVVDGYWSNLAIQWCDPLRVAAEAYRLLPPGGILALSSLGPETFAELRQAFVDVDRYRHTLPFLDEAQLLGHLRQAGFENPECHRSLKVLHYPDMKSLMAAVRELGANRVSDPGRRMGLMGKTAWARFLETYETFRVPQGLPLTYELMCCYATK